MPVDDLGAQLASVKGVLLQTCPQLFARLFGWGTIYQWLPGMNFVGTHARIDQINVNYFNFTEEGFIELFAVYIKAELENMPASTIKRNRRS